MSINLNRLFRRIEILTSALLLGACVAGSAWAGTADAPLSKEEAMRMAAAYLAAQNPGELSASEPVAQGDSWVFPVKAGYSRHQLPDPILINRYTRKITWPHHDAQEDR